MSRVEAAESEIRDRENQRRTGPEHRSETNQQDTNGKQPETDNKQDEPKKLNPTLQRSAYASIFHALDRRDYFVQRIFFSFLFYSSQGYCVFSEFI